MFNLPARMYVLGFICFAIEALLASVAFGQHSLVEVISAPLILLAMAFLASACGSLGEDFSDSAGAYFGEDEHKIAQRRAGYEEEATLQTKVVVWSICMAFAIVGLGFSLKGSLQLH